MSKITVALNRAAAHRANGHNGHHAAPDDLALERADMNMKRTQEQIIRLRGNQSAYSNHRSPSR